MIEKNYELRRSNRRTLALTLDRQGRLIAHAPLRMPLRTIEALDGVNTIGRSQRIRSGIKKASDTGRQPGRPRIKNDKVYQIVTELYFEADEHGNRRYTITEIAQRARVSRATVYRYLDLYNHAGHPALEK